MRILSRAVPSVAAMLTLVLSACGDSIGGNNNTSFDPGRAITDVQNLKKPFTTPVYASFQAMGDKMDKVIGAPALQASAGMLAAAQGGQKPGAVRVAGQQLQALMSARRTAGGPSFTLDKIPAELLGRTFVWDAGAQSYVPSELPGAAVNGVRFMLYAIDNATFAPAVPLNTIGYLDMIGAGSDTLNVSVANSDGATFLDYTLHVNGVDGTWNGPILRGFVSDLSVRADFELKSTISGENNGSMRLGADIKAPTIGVDMVMILETHGLALETGPDFAKLVMQYRAHGDLVDMIGEFPNAANGVLEVSFNQELVARMKGNISDRSSFVAVDLKDNPLPEQTAQAYLLINSVMTDMLSMFVQLTQPLNQFVGWYYLVL